MQNLKQTIRKLSAKLRVRHPLGCGLDVSPIFIVGSGRSGNTLLRRILLNHPDIYIPPETYVLGPAIACFEEHARLEWSTLCRLVLSQFAFIQDFDTFPTPYLRPLYLDLVDAPAELRTCEHILDSFYRYMASQAKPEATVWGDKTPLNVFYLNEIDKLFPRSRYIHIYRNGYDVVASYLRMGRYRTVADAADRWLKSIELCRRFGAAHPERFHEIRYEDLASDPASVVEGVCGFLGMEYSPDLLAPPKNIGVLGDLHAHEHFEGVEKAISTGSIGKGRKALSSEDLRKTEQLIGHKIAELGYS